MENTMMHDHKEGMPAEGMTGKGRCWHWACCIMPIISCLFWVASIVFVVLSWISVMDASGMVWGYGPQWWIWNAVMFGILAMYRGCKMGSCRKGAGCGCGGSCGVCK